MLGYDWRTRSTQWLLMRCVLNSHDIDYVEYTAICHPRRKIQLPSQFHCRLSNDSHKNSALAFKVDVHINDVTWAPTRPFVQQSVPAYNKGNIRVDGTFGWPADSPQKGHLRGKRHHAYLSNFPSTVAICPNSDHRLLSFAESLVHKPFHARHLLSGNLVLPWGPKSYLTLKPC